VLIVTIGSIFVILIVAVAALAILWHVRGDGTHRREIHLVVILGVARVTWGLSIAIRLAHMWVLHMQLIVGAVEGAGVRGLPIFVGS
jgi:hypothetical protein